MIFGTTLDQKCIVHLCRKEVSETDKENHARSYYFFILPHLCYYGVKRKTPAEKKILLKYVLDN